VKPITAFTLARIRARGYIVKEFRVNGTVEFHAVAPSGESAQVARCNDGEDDESAYRAACMLARAVGLIRRGDDRRDLDWARRGTVYLMAAVTLLEGG
jgi:hypothetical protein